MLLITFEGIDGSGKTTQLLLLHKNLIDAGYKAKWYREPGGTEVSEAIRDLLLDAGKTMDPITELLLFSAARSELIARNVRPDLEKGTIVLLDRFYDSTIAYQGFGRKSLDIPGIDRINKTASHGHAPDLTFYFRIPLEEAEKRTDHMEKDRMEKSGTSFYESVIEGFEYLAKKEKRIHTLDAMRQKEDLAREIFSIVIDEMNKKNKP